MTIDRELVTRKLLLIARDLEELREMALDDVAAFVGSRRDQAVVERYLERMIGRAIDVNYPLITETDHPPPSDYHASFTQLADLGVLEARFAAKIARAAGLRNRLVHEYEDLDPRLVFQALQSAFGDVPEYLRRVDEYLAKQVSKSLKPGA
jgi:uncharacterized protein YutE (UPF0331/DUF86 family)